MLFQCGLMYVWTCVEVVCSTWYIRWVSCVLHNVLKCWVASAVRCCAVLRGTVYRYLTCVSDTRWVSLTLTQPVGQSVNHSVSQSVSHLLSLSIWQFTRPKTAATQVSVCGLLLLLLFCSVCAALYDCNTFLRMSHAPLPLLFAAFCQLDAAWQKVIELL